MIFSRFRRFLAHFLHLVDDNPLFSWYHIYNYKWITLPRAETRTFFLAQFKEERRGSLMAKIDSAYNYFLSTYGKDLGDRYESHKKSELRSKYNSILKTNKESPLYKIAQTGDVAKFAIDIKESSNSISHSVANLTRNGDDIQSILDKKIATSDNEDQISAKYVGDDSDETATGFMMEVKKLASPQINTGNYLNPMASDFEEGTYSFDLDTTSASYEFQFNVNPHDTNLEVQQKISRLVNSSDIGLRSEILTNEQNQTALSIYSKNTGLAENEDFLFKITSNTSFNEINRLGISNVTSEASNSSFVLNGKEHSSLSNTFTINKAFEITLNDVTTEPVSIGFKADTEAMADGVSTLIDSYNGMVAVGLKYSSAHSNNRLFNEITGIGNSMKESLAAVGINQEEDGSLSLDRETFSTAISSGNADDHYSTLNKFKNALLRQADKTAINPMNYVNKIVVEYKNPGKTLAYPYAPSAYAGMLIDREL